MPPLGTVTIEEIKPCASDGSIARTPNANERFRYVWHPSEELVDELPCGFSLSLNCEVGPRGVRRFVPSLGTWSFLVEASAGGLAILIKQRNPVDTERKSYRAMFLFFQQGQRLREFLRKSFDREQDLYVPKVARIDGDKADILPADIGLDSHGRGRRWSVAELMAHGRNAAALSGNSGPMPADCIRLGLLASARMNPFGPDELSEEKALAVVRLALFDLGPLTEPIGEELRDLVHSRILGALEPHLFDSRDDFNHWFFEAVDNIVHQVSKKKKEAVRSHEKQSDRDFWTYPFARMSTLHNASTSRCGSFAKPCRNH